jgi:uncharacterized ferredoxin-like protein
MERKHNMSIILNPEKQYAIRVAELICIAARTAPKACGIDHIVTAIVADEADRAKLAEAMRALADKLDAALFARDAQNLMDAEACVIIGTTLERMHIPGCDLCGFCGCEANEAAGGRCALNIGDLGIALGSAASIAADHRVDNRIMYTIGKAAVLSGVMGPEVGLAHAIPLSIKGKNIFFDRKAPCAKR